MPPLGDSNLHSFEDSAIVADASADNTYGLRCFLCKAVECSGSLNLKVVAFGCRLMP